MTSFPLCALIAAQAGAAFRTHSQKYVKQAEQLRTQADGVDDTAIADAERATAAAVDRVALAMLDAADAAEKWARRMSGCECDRCRGEQQ